VHLQTITFVTSLYLHRVLVFEHIVWFMFEKILPHRM